MTVEPRPRKQYGRRLADRILAVFDEACEQGEIETARKLLRVLEALAARPGASKHTQRKDQERLVAAHAHLWRLRQSDKS